jgi:polysaccharide export outer membrane protein
MTLKTTPFLWILVLALLFTGCATQQPATVSQMPAMVAAAPPGPSSYVIQPGDQLDIKFFYNPELNESVTVRPDGKISLQLIDEVKAAGRTPAELDETLTKDYSTELRKPVVTVIVKSFMSQRIYVGGEVNRQGLIDLTAGMTPLQAVLNAGGFKESANPEAAIVIRKGPDNKPVPIRIDLKKALYGEGAGDVAQLQPYDVVYVPKSWIAEANKFVNQYIENLLMFRGVSFGFSYDINYQSVNVPNR